MCFISSRRVFWPQTLAHVLNEVVMTLRVLANVYIQPALASKKLKLAWNRDYSLLVYFTLAMLTVAAKCMVNNDQAWTLCVLLREALPLHYITIKSGIVRCCILEAFCNAVYWGVVIISVVQNANLIFALGLFLKNSDTWVIGITRKHLLQSQWRSKNEKFYHTQS
jgi:hypothetical protein